MDSIYLMTVFVAVAEQLSFAGAARLLDLSSPAVTRAINQLEKNLGAQFLQRNTRRVQLTAAGEAYLEDARTIIGLLRQADDAARGINIIPQGHLRITAPQLFGRLFVMPGIAEYLRRFPEMQVSAMFVDRTVNLIDEGYDVAIRIGQLPDSSMKALRLGAVRRVVCASPAYLAKKGVPQHPGDLQRHSIIGSDGPSLNVTWKFGVHDEMATIRLKSRLSVVSNDAAIEAARCGIGIAQLPSYQVAAQVAAGELKVILEKYPSDQLPIQLLHRESKFGAAKVRSFIDLLSERLRSDVRFR